MLPGEFSLSNENVIDKSEFRALDDSENSLLFDGFGKESELAIMNVRFLRPGIPFKVKLLI